MLKPGAKSGSFAFLWKDRVCFVNPLIPPAPSGLLVRDFVGYGVELAAVPRYIQQPR